MQLNTMQTPLYRTRCMLHVHCICVHVYFVVVYISQSRLPYYRTRCSRYGVYICVMVQLVSFIAVVQCTMATPLYGLQVSHTPYIRWLGVSRTGHMMVRRAKLTRLWRTGKHYYFIMWTDSLLSLVLTAY